MLYPFSLIIFLLLSFLFFVIEDKTLGFNMYLLQFFITSIILTYVPFYMNHEPYKIILLKMTNTERTESLNHLYEKKYNTKYNTFESFLNNIDNI